MIWEYWVEKLDQLGVTIVSAVANDGWNVDWNDVEEYMGDQLPDALINRDSPMIAVGSVYENGSIWERSSPSGNRPGSEQSDAEVSVYAPGVNIPVAITDGTYALDTGNSFAAPIVVSQPRMLHFLGVFYLLVRLVAC